MMPGEAMGSRMRVRVWNLVAPRAWDPSRTPGDGAQGFLGGDDDHRYGEQRQGQAGPKNAAGAESGRGQPFGEKQLIDAAADAIDKKGQAENPVDDGRDAGQVVDGNAHQAHDQTFLGILPQIDGGQNPQGER
jgi:hypothetical protein